MHAAAARWSGALAARGVVAGDRVAVQVDKSVESVLLDVACLRLGAVYVPINTANSANEVEYFLRDAEPRVVVVRPDALPTGATGLVQVETLGAHGDGTLAELAARDDVLPAPRADLQASALAACPAKPLSKKMRAEVCAARRASRARRASSTCATKKLSQPAAASAATACSRPTP